MVGSEIWNNSAVYDNFCGRQHVFGGRGIAVYNFTNTGKKVAG